MSGRDGIFGLRLRWFLFCERNAALSRVCMSAKVAGRGGEIAYSAGPSQSGGGVVWRIGDLEEFGARLDGMAGDIGVIQKNGRAQDDHRVVVRELIGKRLLRGQQTTTKERMGAREGPTRSDRLLIDVGVEMFGECDDLVPSAVFF